MTAVWVAGYTVHTPKGCVDLWTYPSSQTHSGSQQLSVDLWTIAAAPHQDTWLRGVARPMNAATDLAPSWWVPVSTPEGAGQLASILVE
jgi:hypothetical protein